MRWVIVAICVFARLNNITWRDLPIKLEFCDFLIKEDYLTAIPSKSTFHKYWNDVTEANLESWIRMSGFSLTSKQDRDIVIDSSGFELIIGKFWRLVKWGKSYISKTSSIFCKIHIAVALPSRAIVAIETSKSIDSDAKMFGPLWKRCYKRLLRWVSRVHLDKGYWTENIINFLHQEGKKAIIPCKKNSVDHGTDSPMDLLIRQQKKIPGLYKKNNRTHLRAEVEHVFGEGTLYHVVPRDIKKRNKRKTLLCIFLWYNHELMVKGVIS